MRNGPVPRVSGAWFPLIGTAAGLAQRNVSCLRIGQCNSAGQTDGGLIDQSFSWSLEDRGSLQPNDFRQVTAKTRDNVVSHEAGAASEAGAPAADGIDREIGQRLRGARTLRGLSQSEVAEKVGLSFQQIQKYEAGHSRVTAAKLSELARIFALPAGFFFGECDAQGAGGTASPGPLSQEAWTLAGEFERIENPKTRQKVLDLVRTLAED